MFFWPGSCGTGRRMGPLDKLEQVLSGVRRNSRATSTLLRRRRQPGRGLPGPELYNAVRNIWLPSRGDASFWFVYFLIKIIANCKWSICPW